MPAQMLHINWSQFADLRHNMAFCIPSPPEWAVSVGLPVVFCQSGSCCIVSSVPPRLVFLVSPGGPHVSPPPGRTSTIGLLRTLRRQTGLGTDDDVITTLIVA